MSKLLCPKFWQTKNFWVQGHLQHHCLWFTEGKQTYVKSVICVIV